MICRHISRPKQDKIYVVARMSRIGGEMELTVFPDHYRTRLDAGQAIVDDLEHEVFPDYQGGQKAYMSVMGKTPTAENCQLGMWVYPDYDEDYLEYHVTEYAL